ncbi:hypothetical protein [Umezawaea tangerina]|uniref:hypothetical protein n=1 Tax=Umezawaea tangerina TaxID=84725 RepID=UPI0011B2100F|nr:hypothetical protein [Umezawaea tangerina]
MTKAAVAVLGLLLLSIAWCVVSAALKEHRRQEAETWARSQISQVADDSMSKHRQSEAPDGLTEPMPCLGKHHGHQEEAVTVSMLIDRAVKAREALRLNWPDSDPDEPGYLRQLADGYPTGVLPVIREVAEPWYR